MSSCKYCCGKGTTIVPDPNDPDDIMKEDCPYCKGQGTTPVRDTPGCIQCGDYRYLKSTPI